MHLCTVATVCEAQIYAWVEVYLFDKYLTVVGTILPTSNARCRYRNPTYSTDSTNNTASKIKITIQSQSQSILIRRLGRQEPSLDALDGSPGVWTWFADINPCVS